MRKQRLITLLMGILCAIQLVKAQNNSDYYYLDNSVYLDSLLEGKFKDNEPGMVFKIIKSGKVIKQGRYGVANLVSSESIDYDTPFYIASLGKTFTSAAILILYQQGKLDIKDKLSNYFPDLPEYKNRISIENLMNHTSGLPDHFDEMGEDLAYLDNKMVMDFLKGKALLFEPGTDYSYSNSAYVLLSEVIQKASGKSFVEFLNANIFEPLEMKNTVIIESNKDFMGNRAKGYNKTDEGFALNDYENIFTLGAGGIYSTIDDLVKWDKALYGSQILSEESKQLAFTRASIPNKRTYLAMGWMDESFGPGTKAYTGLSYVMSFGVLKGFRAKMMRFVDFDLTMIVLSNSGDIHLWGEDSAKAFFKRK